MKNFDIIIHNDEHLTAILQRAAVLGYNTNMTKEYRTAILSGAGAAFWDSSCSATSGLLSDDEQRKTLDDLYKR